MTKPTRDRLLDAARDLFDRGGIAAVTMGAVASDASVSRQAVYLHFADRTALLIELVDRIDKDNDLDRYRERLEAAPTATDAIEIWAEMQAERNPRLAALGRALDAERSGDSASAEAWRTRIKNRRQFAQVVVGRLTAEGRLHASWDPDHAAVLIAELTSFRVWDDLVNEWELPATVYVRTVVCTILAALAAPFTPHRAQRRGKQPALEKPPIRPASGHTTKTRRTARSIARRSTS